MTGLTLDAGALVALERRRDRVVRLIRRASDRNLLITAPVAVIAEWWRGRTDARERILEVLTVEPMDEGLARLAGEALASVRGATTIDAIVMASAARRGDVVLTSDIGDLERLAGYFPNVRLLAV